MIEFEKGMRVRVKDPEKDSYNKTGTVEYISAVTVPDIAVKMDGFEGLSPEVGLEFFWRYEIMPIDKTETKIPAEKGMDWTVVKSPEDYPPRDTLIVFIEYNGRFGFARVAGDGSMLFVIGDGITHKMADVYCWAPFTLPEEISDYLGSHPSRYGDIGHYLPNIVPQK